eukprot:TRINITY_DN8546_c0_g1_i1.p1 TRINITY_DN8546_c0_g1~~TRINITY_DN8546_c0_g1_i1.p1  ORF type:complete len:255 (+),score=47.78 TRINITY_DN8546_c0_g1_i1:101-766(+)
MSDQDRFRLLSYLQNMPIDASYTMPMAPMLSSEFNVSMQQVELGSMSMYPGLKSSTGTSRISTPTDHVASSNDADDDADDDDDDHDEDNSWDDQVRHVVIKKIPQEILDPGLLAIFADLGASTEAMNSIRLPLRRIKNKVRNCGYCFLEFKTPALAREFYQKAHGYRVQTQHGSKQIIVQRSRRHANPKVPSAARDVCTQTFSTQDEGSRSDFVLVGTFSV